MRSPAIEQLLADGDSSRGGRQFLLLGVVRAALGVIFLVLPLTLFAQSEPGPTIRITILVYNYVHVSPATLAAAEREANKILGAAGAQAAWIECLDQPSAPDSNGLCQKGWTAQVPGLRLISGANKYEDAEFASTAIPVLSTVYYEKITRRARRENADAGLPVILGCVMAHELGHLLLGDPGHSATGVMQPRWGHFQIHQALTGNLLFTHRQEIRIQAQARVLASLHVADPPFSRPTP